MELLSHSAVLFSECVCRVCVTGGCKSVHECLRGLGEQAGSKQWMGSVEQDKAKGMNEVTVKVYPHMRFVYF